MQSGRSNSPKASVNDDLEFTSVPTNAPLEAAAESASTAKPDDEYDSLFSDL